MFAGPKLAGAFCMLDHDFDESVGQLLSGSALVSFKKARAFLLEAFTALDEADKTSLASESWRQTARSTADQILQEVNRNIVEIRARLE